ncbi:MAG: DUF2017 domain-containing protein [Verrucomicrobiota bacterium]|nr:DUF2017 domain-containing protein [Verrucomicrobiota bacterium]
MNFERTEDALVISGIPPFLRDLLKLIEAAAEHDGEESVHSRIFSAPVAPEETQFLDEWKSYVEPELGALFRSALDVVCEDLSKMGRDSDGPRLQIPIDHFDSWLNALNQARLVLATRYHFTETDMSADPSVNIETPRDRALFQVHFYGVLQEVLLHAPQ